MLPTRASRAAPRLLRAPDRRTTPRPTPSAAAIPRTRPDSLQRMQHHCVFPCMLLNDTKRHDIAFQGIFCCLFLCQSDKTKQKSALHTRTLPARCTSGLVDAPPPHTGRQDSLDPPARNMRQFLHMTTQSTRAGTHDLGGRGRRPAAARCPPGSCPADPARPCPHCGVQTAGRRRRRRCRPADPSRRPACSVPCCTRTGSPRTCSPTTSRCCRQTFRANH